MEKYNHKKVESKWQKKWEETDAFLTPENPDPSKKKYILDMFPYPSGEGLHVGHVEGYTATDIYSRFKRMQGFDVLHPMGWDAFGLPAENYAVKTGIPPQETTGAAISNYIRQIKSLGLSYDWSRELNTSAPEYFRFTQWLFLLLYKNGLAYKKEAPVNWCPGCQTVLANEQVVNGECERCGTTVVEKNLAQWFFKITDYAEELIDGLDTVQWPESTKTAQRNWIGKSVGAKIKFPISKKYRFVILHGYGSGPSKHFLPWLQKELEMRGHEVVIPELPDSKNPNISKQIEFGLENTDLDENTVLVGHSLGSVVAMKMLERSAKKIQKLVLVGGFLDAEINSRGTYADTFDWNFDFEKIKANTHEVEILHDRSDDVIPEEQSNKLGAKLSTEVTEVTAKEPHFRADEEADVLKSVVPAVEVFTTRPDTLFGATYMVLAPEHRLVTALQNDITNWDEVWQYIESAKQKTKIERTSEGKEKTGVRIEGVFAINPATQESVPVYVADYVLADYGSGAIMAVPAHDERDFEFAKKYNLPIVGVIETNKDFPHTDAGVLTNSGEFSGIDSEEAKSKITNFVGGEETTTYRLRDWLVSRQRYWGAPIPIVYDPSGNPHPIPEERLPWVLPTDVDYRPKGTSPLGTSKELLERTESIFGKGWTPEVDTMDTFVDSSWYFFRFTDSKNEKEFANKENIKKWLPVDVYVGGAEHTVLHLLYSRFITKVLNKFGYVDIVEPFKSLRHPGMVLASDGNKMSKSKGNVVNPDDVVLTFGADTMRVYEMFMGPFEQSVTWSTDNMVGVRRFLEKVWRLQEKVSDSEESEKALVAETVKKVTEDIENFHFNTAVSSLMILANSFEKKNSIARVDLETFMMLLSPFAPHISAEIFECLGKTEQLHSYPWPEYDESDLTKDKHTITVQVNGKVRDSIEVDSNTTEEELKELAVTDKTKKWIEVGEVRKVIIVPGKIINFVVS